MRCTTPLASTAACGWMPASGVRKTVTLLDSEAMAASAIAEARMVKRNCLIIDRFSTQTRFTFLPGSKSCGTFAEREEGLFQALRLSGGSRHRSEFVCDPSQAADK